METYPSFWKLEMIQILFRNVCSYVILPCYLLVAGAASAADISLGLPPIPVDADNPQTPEKLALGKLLFDDQRLSADGKVSCATCHQSDLAFTDGLKVAKGVSEQEGTRNTPTLLNVAYQKTLFWDGRRERLEEQARDPFFHRHEHGLKDANELLKRIVSDNNYVSDFKRVFGVPAEKITLDHISQALAAFQRTLVAGDSAFDRYYYGGEQTALSPASQRGFELFKGRAQCTTCHTLSESSALLTDQQFHSLAIGLKRIQPRLAELSSRVAHSTEAERGQLILEDADFAELGRFLVTQNAADIGKFKTPSLRNVAVTAPYMHDGSVANLEEAVDLEVYYRGLAQNRPLVLTVEEKADLIEFLRTLTSSSLTGK